MSNNVTFENNMSTNPAGQTFSLKNTNEAEISGANFRRNPQTNVLVELGQLNVDSSEFTAGQVNHIKGVDSSVRISRVNVHDSSSEASGHGFICSRCLYVNVENSSF